MYRFTRYYSILFFVITLGLYFFLTSFLPNTIFAQEAVLPDTPASQSAIQNNFENKPEGKVVINIIPNTPLSLDEITVLQKRNRIDFAILESNFSYKGETITDFFMINSPTQNIQEDFRKNRSGFLKLIDEAKQKKASLEATQIIKSDNQNIQITRISEIDKVVAVTANTDNIFNITKITIIDSKSKSGGIQNDFPNAKINTFDIGSNDVMRQQAIANREKISEKIKPLATSDYVNRVPVSGNSQFGAIQGGGRFYLEYMMWDTINFGSSDTYEHDIFLDNSDGKSYLDSANTGWPGCYPRWIYAGTNWPKESIPYIDTRETKTGVCDEKNISFTIGAAQANALKPKTNYYTLMGTADGNTTSDQFTLELQIGYYYKNKPEVKPPVCNIPLFTPDWCSFPYGWPNDYAAGSHIKAIGDKENGKWSSTVPGTQVWKYIGVIPQSVSSVSAENITTSSQNVYFTDNSTNENSFAIEIKVGSGNWAPLGNLNEMSGYGSHAASVSNLSANTKYCYRFKAVNTAGSSAYSNEGCATTAPLTRSEVVVDDLSSDFIRGGTAWWAANAGYNNHMYYTFVNGNKVSSTGEWWANLVAGNYEVYVYIPNVNATSATSKYEISTSNGTVTKTVNQNNYSNVFVSLGTYNFPTGRSKKIRLTDATGETNTKLKIGFDAVKFTPR